MGLDKKAIEAIRTWRFEPGQINGHAVAVEIAIEGERYLNRILPARVGSGKLLA
jgi:TonB-like protein